MRNIDQVARVGDLVWLVSPMTFGRVVSEGRNGRPWNVETVPIGYSGFVATDYAIAHVSRAADLRLSVAMLAEALSVPGAWVSLDSRFSVIYTGSGYVLDSVDRTPEIDHALADDLPFVFRVDQPDEIDPDSRPFPITPHASRSMGSGEMSIDLSGFTFPIPPEPMAGFRHWNAWRTLPRSSELDFLRGANVFSKFPLGFHPDAVINYAVFDMWRLCGFVV